MPKIYIGDQVLRLIIYHVVGFMVVLLVEDKEEVYNNAKLLTKFANHIKRKATELCKVLNPTIKLTEEAPDANYYYYFNYVNNAIKLSSLISNDLLRRYDIAVILNNLHDNLNLKSKG